MMSSTTRTWRPSMLMSRSLRMRTTPEESRRRAVAGDRHEVDLAGNRQLAHQVGHEEDGALEDADEQQVAALVVGRDLLAELRDAARAAASSSIRTSPTPRSSSVCAHAHASSLPAASTIPGTATTSSPRTTSGHASRSDRGILASTNTSWIFLLRPASRSPGRQPRTLRPASVGFDRHGAPADLALERDRRVLEPDAVVLAHGGDAAAEVEARRAVGRRRAARRAPAERSAVGQAEQVPVGGRVELARSSGRISLADQAALRVRVGRVDAEGEALGAAVRLASPRARARAAAGRRRPRGASLIRPGAPLAARR